MRINNINDVCESDNLNNKNIFICTEKVRNYLISKGVFETGTVVSDNILKYIYLKTGKLKMLMAIYEKTKEGV